MTPQQIAKKVQEAADARFPEVIERLLFLLEAKRDLSHFIKKWRQTGLLSDIAEEDMGEAAFALETTALALIDECTKKGDTSWETNEELICKRFHQAVYPYKSPPIGPSQRFSHNALCDRYSYTNPPGIGCSV